MRWKLFAVLCVLVIIPRPSYALVPFLGWGYSVGYGIGWLAGSEAHRKGYAWSTVFDPPANVLRGKITFSYDPSLIIVHPEFSGFVGVFSDNPATHIPYNPSGVYGDIYIGSIPGPRSGMTWNLNVGANTVSLEFDVSANPVSVSETEHLNFFALAIETTVQLTGWVVEPTATGHFWEVGNPQDQSQTFMVCSDAQGDEYLCGEVTSLGLTAVPVPEPLPLYVLGAALVALAGRGRRLRSRRPRSH